MTSEERANQIAEDALLAAMQCATRGFGYSDVRHALADEIAKALRTREAETWEQAAQYVSDVGNPTLANAMRSWRAAQPQEPTT